MALLIVNGPYDMDMYNIHGLQWTKEIPNKFLHGTKKFNINQIIRLNKIKMKATQHHQKYSNGIQNMASKFLPCCMHLLVSSIWQT